jgi:tRNA pseudouridine55 synthase
VTIHALRLSEFAAESLSLNVDCSKGTYIRSLAQDIGDALGCGAHLSALRRTRIGRLQPEQSLNLAELELLLPAQRDALLLPVDTLLSDLPCAGLEANDALRLRQGQPVRWSGATGRWRAYGDGRFIGLCELDRDGWLTPRRLVAVTEQNTRSNA